MTFTRLTYLLLACLLSAASVAAQQPDEPQEPTPTVTITDRNGEETTLAPGELYSGEAPLQATLLAGAQEADGYLCVCEWQFIESGEAAPFLTRYEGETQYTFNRSGSFSVKLIVGYTLRTNSEIVYEYEFEPFGVSLSESSLKAPNAFSPNGDGINDYYNVYDVKSIVAFKGIIVNRWGQKLYTWGLDQIGCDDCGWDGTYNGSPVKDGVYFVAIDARGADGITYTIRKDVNLLRGFTETGGTTAQ